MESIRPGVFLWLFFGQDWYIMIHLCSMVFTRNTMETEKVLLKIGLFSHPKQMELWFLKHPGFFREKKPAGSQFQGESQNFRSLRMAYWFSLCQEKWRHLPADVYSTCSLLADTCNKNLGSYIKSLTLQGAEKFLAGMDPAETLNRRILVNFSKSWRVYWWPDLP